MNKKLRVLNEKLKQVQADLLEVSNQIEVLTSDESLKVGDKVRFIGPAEEFHENVTVGKVYEINDLWVNGELTFLDDGNTLESFSIIDPDTRHLFEKVVEVEQVPIVKKIT